MFNLLLHFFDKINLHYLAATFHVGTSEPQHLNSSVQI